jgi:hypothetical protein
MSNVFKCPECGEPTYGKGHCENCGWEEKNNRDGPAQGSTWVEKEGD